MPHGAGGTSQQLPRKLEQRSNSRLGMTDSGSLAQHELKRAKTQESLGDDSGPRSGNVALKAASHSHRQASGASPGHLETGSCNMDTTLLATGGDRTTHDSGNGASVPFSGFLDSTGSMRSGGQVPQVTPGQGMTDSGDSVNTAAGKMMSGRPTGESTLSSGGLLLDLLQEETAVSMMTDSLMAARRRSLESSQESQVARLQGSNVNSTGGTIGHNFSDEQAKPHGSQTQSVATSPSAAAAPAASPSPSPWALPSEHASSSRSLLVIKARAATSDRQPMGGKLSAAFASPNPAAAAASSSEESSLSSMSRGMRFVQRSGRDGGAFVEAIDLGLGSGGGRTISSAAGRSSLVGSRGLGGGPTTAAPASRMAMGERGGLGSASLGVMALDLASGSSARNPTAAVTNSASGGAGDWVPPPFESPPGHEMDGLSDLPPQPIIGLAKSPRSREERSLRTRSVGMPSSSPG